MRLDSSQRELNEMARGLGLPLPFPEPAPKRRCGQQFKTTGLVAFDVAEPKQKKKAFGSAKLTKRQREGAK